MASAAADKEKGMGGERGWPGGLKKRDVAVTVSEISGRKKIEHPYIYMIEAYSPRLGHQRGLKDF